MTLGFRHDISGFEMGVKLNFRNNKQLKIIDWPVYKVNKGEFFRITPGENLNNVAVTGSHTTTLDTMLKNISTFIKDKEYITTKNGIIDVFQLTCMSGNFITKHELKHVLDTDVDVLSDLMGDLNASSQYVKMKNQDLYVHKTFYSKKEAEDWVNNYKLHR